MASPTYPEVEAVATRVVSQYPELVRKYRRGSHKVVGYLMARVIMEFGASLETSRDPAVEAQRHPDPFYVKAAVESALMAVPV